MSNIDDWNDPHGVQDVSLAIDVIADLQSCNNKLIKFLEDIYDGDGNIDFYDLGVFLNEVKGD